MRISDWSSDVCSSDLGRPDASGVIPGFGKGTDRGIAEAFETKVHSVNRPQRSPPECPHHQVQPFVTEHTPATFLDADQEARLRSEEHTSELQSLMRISYAVFCLKKKKHLTHTTNKN